MGAARAGHPVTLLGGDPGAGSMAAARALGAPQAVDGGEPSGSSATGQPRAAALQDQLRWLAGEVKQLRCGLNDIKTEIELVNGKIERIEDHILGAEDFELVMDEPPEPEGLGFRYGGAADGPGFSGRPVGKAGPKGKPGGKTEEERAEIAQGIGRFFIRCLNGVYRGKSGRDNLDLPSSIFVVIRDIWGVVHLDPVKVFDSYQGAKAVVSLKGKFGDSMFCGFPSVWEAKVAVSAAGGSWPRT